MNTVVEMRNISKVYPEGSKTANRGVSLDLREGEILCLAGENGAGKSTLMNILYGLTPPSSGEIFVRGQPVVIHSPLDANRLGIGMVHQHFMLFPDFTVAQNVVMGAEPRHLGFFYDFKKANALVQDLIRQHRFSLDAEKPVGSLTVGQKQQTEILKLLYRKADVLILDEPTSVLTDQEIASLFETFRSLAASGKSLALITHKLEEIKLISGRVAVMRRGEMVTVRNTAEIDEAEITRLMMEGSSSTAPITSRRAVNSNAAPVIAFENVTLKRRDQAHLLLDRISFVVHAGEILGFTGTGDNGTKALEAALTGFAPVSSGRILYRDRDISRCGTRELRRLGLAYVPADRLATGSAAGASVTENLIINKRRELFRGAGFPGFLNGRKAAEFTRSIFSRYTIDGGAGQRLSSLSGGNIQKLILGREIEQYRDYMVLSEPAWGLDAAASRFIYGQIAALRDRGAAVILISTNLDELLALANRIMVFYRGAVAAEIPGNALYGGGDSNTIKAEIGAYMLGLKTKAAARG
jgi:simple sugar transport system ATP-binding protein